MLKKYRLLKETPELKKGAILVAECEGYEKEDCKENVDCAKCDECETFECKDKKFLKYTEGGVAYDKENVTEQPEWFEEVEEILVRKKDVPKLKKLLKK